MKKSLFFLASLPLLASCASDELVDTSVPSVNGNGAAAISFTTSRENITRATLLQNAGHYNFGVFAYKSTDKENNVMDNYLVGYLDATNGYDTSAGTTVGDQAGVENGLSYWMYEGMGKAEYFGKFAGKDLTDEYKSNNDNQYLKYWDKSADATYFYAYAPYINGSGTAQYVDGTGSETYTLTIPDGSLKSGMNNASLYEYMYASKKVPAADYGKDVELSFKRLVAKVNIKFWEDIPGYSVRILDLQEGTYDGVQAVPSVKDGTSNNYGYKLGEYYETNGVKIKFSDGEMSSVTQLGSTTVSTPLVFSAPTDSEIGVSRVTASSSSDTYYAIPKYDANAPESDLSKSGLTFHVTYELTSDTGERIVVKDATAFVPSDYVSWDANTHYTYIFKITKGSNGSTDPSHTIDPTDPEVPTIQSLYPIVFDNCTVEDWIEKDNEPIISEGTKLSYYSVQLDQYSMTNSQDNVLDVDVKRVSQKLGNALLENEIVTVTKPAVGTAAPVVVTTAVTDDPAIKIEAGKITVKAGAAPGTYTVTYKVPADDIDQNQPRSVTTTFTVGNAYTVATNLTEVSVGAKLSIKVQKATTGTAFADLTTLDGTLSIEYLPQTAPSAEEQAKVKVNADNQVEVAADAAPGSYTLVYKVDGKAVARCGFNVVKYTFALDKTQIGLGASTIVSTCLGTLTTACTDYTITVTAPTSGSLTGITVDNTAKTISIDNTAGEGEYTVTYKVHNACADAVSTASYTATFTVSNTYTVALSKTEIDSNQDATGDYGSDFITITSTKNGVADVMSAELANKYTVAGLTKGTDYTITYVAATPESGTPGEAGYTPAVPACIKLQVKKSVASGNYKVVYTGQTGKTAEAPFVVKQ